MECMNQKKKLAPVSGASYPNAYLSLEHNTVVLGGSCDMESSGQNMHDVYLFMDGKMRMAMYISGNSMRGRICSCHSF